jgi:hypothetical protein
VSSLNAFSPGAFEGGRHITWKAVQAIILLPESFMRQYQRGSAARLCQTTNCKKREKKLGLQRQGQIKLAIRGH